MRKRRIGDVGDATFGKETRLRSQDDAMSVGAARFLREVYVVFWMVMMRPRRWDPLACRRCVGQSPGRCSRVLHSCR